MIASLFAGVSDGANGSNANLLWTVLLVLGVIAVFLYIVPLI